MIKGKSLTCQGGETRQVRACPHWTSGNQTAIEDEIGLSRTRLAVGEEEEGMGTGDDPVQPAVEVQDLVEEVEVLLGARRALETQLRGQTVTFFYECLTQSRVFSVEKLEKGH